MKDTILYQIHQNLLHHLMNAILLLNMITDIDISNIIKFNFINDIINNNKNKSK